MTTSAATFAQVTIEKLEPMIVKMVQSTKESYELQFEQKFTKLDEKYARLSIKYDLLKAIETYTKSTDELVEFTARRSIKGNIQINASVKREDTIYDFNTEAIYAGGYNIQRLHYRYITKTDLPKSKEYLLSTAIALELKQLTKIEKLQKEIDSYERCINKNDERVAANVNLTDEQIVEILKQDEKYYEWPTWQVIVERGADKNYNFDEEHYNNEIQKSIDMKIQFYKEKHQMAFSIKHQL